MLTYINVCDIIYVEVIMMETPENLINWFFILPLELKIKLYNHWRNTEFLGLQANYVEILKVRDNND